MTSLEVDVKIESILLERVGAQGGYKAIYTCIGLHSFQQILRGSYNQSAG